MKLGDRVRKLKGSSWQGVIVGTYSTALTPEGYAVESELEKGSVQIYPASALEPLIATECKQCLKYGTEGHECCHRTELAENWKLAEAALKAELVNRSLT